MELFKDIAKFKDNVALLSDNYNPVSYNEILIHSEKIKEHLNERTLILVISENSVGSIISYISCLRNNCVVLLIDIKTKKKDILKLIKIYRPEFIMAPINIIKSYLEISNIKKKIFNYGLCETGIKNSLILNKELCLLLPTSGSLGSPKFVRLSKNNLLFNCRSILKYLEIKTSHRSLTTMPSSYSYMLSIINTYLYSGASIFVENKSILQREFWENYKKNKITSFSGVPYIFETLIKLGFEKILTKNLREITQAGGKLNTETQKKIADICKKNKIKFFIMYGQTEASPRISYLDSKFASKKIGSIGKAVPGTQMWLEDLNQKIIKKPNQIGELKIKGKNVSLGYSYKFEDLNNKDENKGVLRTGDLAFFDKDNFYFLKGRKDRIIKIFGNRLSLDELEAKMNEIGFSLICNVEGNKIKVFFEKEYNIIDLKNKISEVSNQNSSIFDFKLIKKIPRTSSDKIDYKKLNTL